MRKLDKSYKEIENLYNTKGEAGIEEAIAKLEKEVAGKERGVENLEGEQKSKLEKEVESGKKKLDNYKGYKKNRQQIKKIQQVRKNLENKLRVVKQQKDDSKKAYAEAKAKYELAKKDLDKEQKEAKGNMMQDEYNALVEKVESLKNEMNNQKEIFEKSKNKIADLEGKIGKCDLAWRTLFANKTWDDIQMKVTTNKQRFTRAKSEDEIEKIDEEQEKENQETAKEVPENDEKQVAEGDEKAVIKVEQKNNPLKKLWNKIKEKFLQAKNFVSRENSEKNKNPENTPKGKHERDEFLEGLRKHVDVEYSKTVREAKEEEYMQKHSAKRTQESQGREPGDD